MTDRYKIVGKISHSPNSRVYLATEKATNKEVVIKKIEAGFIADREVVISRQMNHPNIIKMFESFVAPDNFEMIVMEKCRGDLQQLIDVQMLSGDQVQMYTRQMFEGLRYLESQRIIHRDIKTQNMLIDANNNLKICDFGLARLEGTERPQTMQMVSLWYRPTDVILGNEVYTYTTDIWSAACVMAEMYRRWPLFKSDSSIEITAQHLQVLGTLDPADFEGFEGFEKMTYLDWTQPTGPQCLHRAVKEANAPAIDLMLKCLKYNPDHRISAATALAHPYFQEPDRCRVRERHDYYGFPLNGRNSYSFMEDWSGATPEMLEQYAEEIAQQEQDRKENTDYMP